MNEIEKMKCKVFHSLHSEVRNGEVWISNNEFTSRLIHIKNIATNKTIIVTKRVIDKNFTEFYKKTTKVELTENATIIDEYYRNKLGIEIEDNQKFHELELKSVSSVNIYYKIKYLLDHPNDSIRLSTWLAIISIVLSIIPYLMNIFSCFNSK